LHGGTEGRAVAGSAPGKPLSQPLSANPTSIAYYITAHGYGHGVRSCDIIRALNRLRPGIRIILVSDLPAAFFRNRVDLVANALRPGSFDSGMVQLDSIRVDVEATLREVESLLGRWEELLDQERRFLCEQGIGLVVSDIPAIPIEAAAALGIPALAVGNFGWDWIYSAYAAEDARWRPSVEAYQRGYSKADLLLRLPFSDEMNAFPHKEDIPVVAHPGRRRRTEIASLSGCSPESRWILLSFTTLEWDAAALDKVEELRDYQFFTVLPLQWRRRNIFAIDRDQVTFSDVVASVDCVLSKPGFGIISECAVNHKPLIYADRSDFLEYAVLENAIKKYLKNVHIPVDQLYQGELREALEAVWSSKEPAVSAPVGGAQIAASRILGKIDVGH
jgi:hypothetical protein